MTIGVSDHALLRFLERAATLDIEGLRANLKASLERAHAAARSLSGADYLIKADGLIYVVRGDTVTSVLPDKSPTSHASMLTQTAIDGSPTPSGARPAA